MPPCNFSCWSNVFCYDNLGWTQRDRLLQSRAVAALLRRAALRPVEPHKRQGVRNPRGHFYRHDARFRAGHLPHGRRRGEHQLLELVRHNQGLDGRERLELDFRVELLSALESLPNESLREADQSEQWKRARRYSVDKWPYEQRQSQVPRSQKVHCPDLDDWN